MNGLTAFNLVAKDYSFPVLINGSNQKIFVNSKSMSLTSIRIASAMVGNADANNVVTIFVTMSSN